MAPWPAAALQNFPNSPNVIVAGPDHALWFSELRGDKIGRITPGGEVAEFPVPAGTGPVGLAVGRDGALWIAGYSGKEILRMTTGGVVTDRYPVPWEGSTPLDLQAGPDGSLWFTDTEGSRIGRVTLAGITAPPGGLPRTGGAPPGGLVALGGLGVALARAALGGRGRARG